MCALMRVFIFTCCGYTCMCVQCWVSLLIAPHPHCLRQVLSLNLELIAWLGWLASELGGGVSGRWPVNPQDSASLASLQLGLIH